MTTSPTAPPPASNLAHMRTVDLSPFMTDVGAVVNEPATAAQQRAASQIHAAFSTHGFLYLSNLGVTRPELDAYFATAAALFQLPRDVKEGDMVRFTTQSNQGYVPRKSETLNRTRKADVKETYNFQHPGYVKQDFRGCPDGFERFCASFWAKMETASQRFAIACALALRLPPRYFAATLKRYNSAVIRLNYFPPSEYDPELSTGQDLQASLRVSEHIDWGMFTILFNDEPGLQVKSVDRAEYENGHTARPGWLDVPVPTGATAIVNTGSLICRWTNDLWKASAHRVIIGNEQQAGKERISIGCFFHPDEDEVISVDSIFVKPGQVAKYEDVTTKQYIRAKLEDTRTRI